MFLMSIIIFNTYLEVDESFLIAHLNQIIKIINKTKITVITINAPKLFNKLLLS